ncbi:PREDICTED: WAT1-related protein At4g15540-like [Camelina sativa]|uniref:WAT1-related protein At4g15540-like n=1 Tax=Camelina sativa TaxID=90675 RepID=A0ABM0WBT7_CAMSA|nr:PREDICTED: WAT1-related protein At4g15540-like [Camelina sativa]
MREETVSWKYFKRDVVPFAAMVAVECTTVGSSTLFKAATLRGFSFYVFVLYSYVGATLVLLLLSLIFGRYFGLLDQLLLPCFKNMNLHILHMQVKKSSLFFKIFLLALLGLTSRVAGCKGIEYSSPTLSSAISNLTPAFTFMLAVFFRMEQVMLRSSATQAKIIGTIVSISGALVIVLYKGPKLLVAASFTSFESSWITGGLLLGLQFLLLSVWFILQTHIMEIYPEEIVVVFFYNLCAMLISATICLIVEKDLSSWQLKPGFALASVIYSGLFDTSLGSVIHTWGLHVKGPVYVSLFKPFSIAIAVAMAAIFLGDALHLGSVIGSVILSFGFYTVIWGKAREDAIKRVSDSEQSLLLPTHNTDDETLS